MLEQRAIAITIATGVVAVAISSCGFFTSESKTESTEPLPPPQQPVAAQATPPKATAAPAPLAITALTPPTNPKEYVARLSDTGRPNPFEPVPVPRTAVPVPRTGSPRGNGTTNSIGTVDRKKGNGSTRRPVAPPPPPPPVDAQAVQVFGVAAINGRLQAVIRSPKENVTRTVQVGDTIAGTVLVRSIDAYGTEPAVILEQFGQTVRVPVSKPTAAQAAQPAPI